MVPKITAQLDPALRATVTRRRALNYAAGADETLDRPGYVRSASSLAYIGDQIAVIQDDANFIALLDPDSFHTEALALPAGEGGLRQFDDVRGNKRYKLDLEACVAIPGTHGATLLAFGSGSTTAREQIVIVEWRERDPQITLCNAATLYAVLRAETTFAGSELNIEGALFVDSAATLRLFQRGNGAPHGDLVPVDATCDLAWADLHAYLQSGGNVPPPAVTNIVQYDLGAIDSARLTFTDAVSAPGVTLYAASAEDSPDATRDGPVAGSAIGVLDGRTARWALLRDEHGNVFDAKVEGLLLRHDNPRHAFLVVDPDDPARASELCEIVLEGPWYVKG